jgi:hypothetical protein
MATAAKAMRQIVLANMLEYVCLGALGLEEKKGCGMKINGPAKRRMNAEKKMLFTCIRGGTALYISLEPNTRVDSDCLGFTTRRI